MNICVKKKVCDNISQIDILVNTYCFIHYQVKSSAKDLRVLQYYSKYYKVIDHTTKSCY